MSYMSEYYIRRNSWLSDVGLISQVLLGILIGGAWLFGQSDLPALISVTTVYVIEAIFFLPVMIRERKEIKQKEREHY